MAISVACACGQRFAAKESLAGKTVSCPKCGGQLTIPAPQMQQPLGGNSLDDLSGLESSSPGMPAGGTPTTAQGSPLGNPLQGSSVLGNPGGMGASSHSMLSSGGWQQPAPTKSRGSKKGLIIGLSAGGSVAFVLIIVVVVFVLTGSDDPVVSQSNSTNNNSSPSTSLNKSSGEHASQPANKKSSSTEKGARHDNTDSGTSGNQPPMPKTNRPSGSDPASDDSEPMTDKSSRPDPPPSSADAKPVDAAPRPASFMTGLTDWHAGDPSRLQGTRPARASKSKLIFYRYSWMCQLLPHLGHQQLYDQIDFGVDFSAKQNARTATTVVPQFMNPQDKRARWKGFPFDGLALTHYVGVSGVEDGRNVVAAQLPRDDPRAGVFSYTAVARPEEITDGTSQTVMIAGAGELASPWIQGGGATIRGAREPYLDPISGFGSKGAPTDGTLVVLADGSVHFLSSAVSPEVFRAMCTIHGGDPFDTNQLGEKKTTLAP